MPVDVRFLGQNAQNSIYPAWRAYSAPPDPLAVFQAAYF